MANTIGEKYKITVFGQSHAPGIGAVIDGLPAGIEVPFVAINKAMKRRAPKKAKYSTARSEKDGVEFVSGIVNGHTCGAPICAIIRNEDKKSKDYEKLQLVPRPGHADYPAYIKYEGFNDIAGGGQFSGRLTAPITIAGAIAKEILADKGIQIVARIKQIYNIKDSALNINEVTYEQLKGLTEEEFPVVDKTKAQAMLKCIEDIKKEGDSVGGIVECFAFGLPVGLGEPLYDSVESVIAKNMYSIPGVRGIEFGLGMNAIELKGSEHNDEYYINDGKVKTRTNNHGGVIGGLTTGMPLIFRVAFKPTSSISKKQESINLKTKETETLEIKGRHDACFVPRALVALEMMTAISLLDMYMQKEKV